jgi:hypothetical protein
VTGVPAPAGWTARTPPTGPPNCLLEWQITHGGHLTVRVFGPYTTGKRGEERTHLARAEWRTGVSSFGPDFTDPAVQREFGWAVLQATKAAAEVLAAANGPATDAPADDAEPDDGHLTIFDFEELARG